MSSNTPSSKDPECTAKQIIEDRLKEAGIDPKRTVSVEEGIKKSFNHDDFALPTERDGNYGVYATTTDYLVLIDVDDYELDDDEMNPGLAALRAALPDTLAERTPHGGRHYYIIVTHGEDIPPATVFHKEFGTPKGNVKTTWGDVQVAKKFVVGAGSELNRCDKDWHDCSDPDEGQYELVKDAPIAEVSVEKMVEILAADEKVSREGDDTTEADSREQEAQTDGGTTTSVSVDGVPETPEERLELARKWDDKLDAVLNGDYSDFQKSDGSKDRSEGECHAVAKMAFYLPNATDREIRRLMDRSDAEKWAERTDSSYRDSVMKAVDEVSDHYDWEEYPQYDSGGQDECAAHDAVKSAQDAVSMDDYQPHGMADRLRMDVIIPADPPEDVNLVQISTNTLRDRTARILREYHDWVMPRDVQGWRETLYWYDPAAGIYRPRGEEKAAELVEEHLGDLATDATVREVTSKLKRHPENVVYEAEDLNQPDGVVAVENGLLNLRNGTLNDHTPDVHLNTRIPVAYDSGAECPRIDEFLTDLVPDERVPTLYRIAAHALYPGVPEAKSVMIVGGGANGKSTYARVVEELVGADNTARVGLDELAENRFALSRTHNAHMVLDADMAVQRLNDLSPWKRMTGEQEVTADVKYEQPIRFDADGTFVALGNGVPEMPEENPALYRRWLYLPFPNQFSGEDRVPEDQLIDELTQTDELEGLLARAVEEIQEWADGRDFFPLERPSEERIDLIRRAQNPVKAFADVWLLPEAGDNPIPKDELKRAYDLWAQKENLPRLPKWRLSDRLYDLDDWNVSGTRTRSVGPDNDRVPVYRGAAWNPAAREYFDFLDVDNDDEADDGDDDGGEQVTVKQASNTGGLGAELAKPPGYNCAAKGSEDEADEEGDEGENKIREAVHRLDEPTVEDVAEDLGMDSVVVRRRCEDDDTVWWPGDGGSLDLLD